MRMRYAVAMTAVIGVPGAAQAADLTLKVELPRLTVAEYHAPYAAFWLERADQSFAGNLAVWYDLKKKNNEGTKWLKDMRQWWRKSGRDLQVPFDGLSGATRAPGEHTLSFNGAKPPFDKLPPGDYQVVIETARESGGRELLRVPLQWPPKAPQTTQARGDHELGTVSAEARP